MTGLVSFDEALKSAFQLAYFLQRDRTTAILLTVSAMNKLTVAAATQNRRLYYIPTGRTALRAARTKIYLTQLHLLQRLIYLDSEPFERLKENQVGTLHEDDLVVHFIKHLVRITTRRNSFYVTVGLSRVLHDYSTPETKEIYSVIVQDPERVKDDFYYRSRKKQLMGELKSRFGDQVKIQQGARGEERFQARETSEALFQLVSESLSQFTPWATNCVLPATFEPRKHMINSLAFSDQNPDAEHEIEINRLHTLLDPACFSRLVSALGYDAPVQRLTIPTFFNSAQGPRQDRLSKTELTQEELQAIKDSLSGGAVGRKKTSGDELLIKVDGQERARFDPARTTKVELTVSPSADLIEVYSLDAAGEVLLAAHLLAYHDSGIRPTQSSVVLEGGQRVSFTLRPAETPSGEVGDTLVIIAYSETHPLRVAALWQRRLNRLTADRPLIKGWQGVGALKPALFLLLALTGLLGLLRYLQSNNNANKQPTIAQKESPPATLSASPSPTPQPTQQAKTPDEQRSPAPKPRKKTSATSADITAEAGTTRMPRAKQAAQSLLSVRNVYVDPLGDDPFNQLLRESLSRGLQATGRFVVVQNRDEAQAVLKGAVRKTPATKTQRVSIAVRLISADGQVVWPIATPVKGRKYVGSVEKVAARIVDDLQSALRQLERK